MKHFNWKSLIAAAALTAVALVPGQSLATTLGLVIDSSGSIGAANFIEQRNAYVNALNNVIDDSLYGDIAIGVWQFSTNVTEIINYTTINNAGDLATVTNAIAGMTYTGGFTQLAGGIDAAVAAAVNFGPLVNSNLVIDVSTDGRQCCSGQPGDPVTAAANAVTDGLLASFDNVNINSLLIGGNAVGGFETGDGLKGDQSFSVSAATFAEVQTALESKITREIGGQVPEPSTVILFGTGLAGLAAWRMRKAKQAA